MIDITTIKEVLGPVSQLEQLSSQTTSKSTKLFWVTIVIIILIFCIWGYIAYRENQLSDRNKFSTN